MIRCFTLLTALIALLLVSAATAQDTGGAVETSYQSRPETSYQASRAPAAQLSGVVSTETGFNPSGTHSRSTIGLISVRRNSPEYPAFLLGMQDASIKAFKDPLNVASLKAESLADQAEELEQRGVKVFLVDSPDPAKAAGFFKRNQFLQRQAVLLSHAFPRGYNPPLVLASPILSGERVAEEAIRFVGNTTVEVAYILGEEPSDSIIEDFEKKLQDAYLKPFANVAPKITVTRVDPDNYTPSLVPPAVVCLPADADSRLLAPTLHEKFPSSKIVAVGESPEVVAAFRDKRIHVRIRPDYQRILGFAMQEAAQKSTMPIVVHPTMDKHWD